MASEPTASHQRRAFAERLTRAPLLLDGAMGTLLFSRGVPQRASLDEIVDSRPDLIGAIHREYIDAGADAIETNSFGANRLRLAPFGLADRAGHLSRRAAQIAREARDVAGKRDVFVAGSIGPLESPRRTSVHHDQPLDWIFIRNMASRRGRVIEVPKASDHFPLEAEVSVGSPIQHAVAP